MADPAETPEGRPDSLAARFAAGDAAALRRAYDDYGELVHRVGLSTLPTTRDAEHLVRQVFVRAWRSRHAFDATRGTLLGWLLDITRRELVELLADARRRGDEERAPHAAGRIAPVAADLARVVDQVLLADEFDRLADEQRTVVRLVLFAGLTHGQAAAATGLPLDTVETQVRRALGRLRTRWEADGPGPS